MRWVPSRSQTATNPGAVPGQPLLRKLAGGVGALGVSDRHVQLLGRAAAGRSAPDDLWRIEHLYGRAAAGNRVALVELASDVTRQRRDVDNRLVEPDLVSRSVRVDLDRDLLAIDGQRAPARIVRRRTDPARAARVAG